MPRANDSSGTPGSPSLSELLTRYLERQGAGFTAPQPAGEVVPFEAVPVQPVNARLAWEEALRPVGFFSPGFDTQSFEAPPEWPTLVATHEPATALAFCLGNFPQLVRDLQPLWRADDLATLRPGVIRPAAGPDLLDWATRAAGKNHYPQTLLALGCLRLARQFDSAVEFMQAHEKDVPAEWRAAWSNEQAALAWHQGRAEEARALWQAQPVSVPVLFNRGMAALFFNRPAEARPWLAEAVAQLTDQDAWHHLGWLYLALAEMRE